MNRQSVTRGVLPSLFVLLFCFSGVPAQETENTLPTREQRRIVALLLEDKFNRSNEETIYISTANLAGELQKNFPRFKNKKIRLVSPEAAAKDSGICAYEFGKFEFIDKFVSVTFGNCRDGLAYDFIKDAGGWKNVGSTVTRQLSY